MLATAALSSMLVAPNASFANLNKPATTFQAREGARDVVVVAEAV